MICYVQTSCQSSRPTVSATRVASLFTVFVLIDPLLLEIEVEEMSQKLELMERNHAHIEAIQTQILQTQSIILSRLEKVERALLPQKHSTPNRFRVTDLASTRSRWEWQEDDYYMEWNRSDSIQPLPSPVRPLADGHQIPVVSTNQAPHYGIDHSMPYHRHLAHGTEPTLSYHRGLGHGTEPTLPNHRGLGLGTELSTHTQPRDCSFSPEPFPIKFSDNILPSSEIDRSSLTTVDAILSKFSKLRCESKVGTLAVKLAKEALFGDKVLIKCTVMGERGLPGLPAAELMELKKILFREFPHLWASRHEFEALWKTCVDSLGQACKRLRHKNPSGLM